MKLSIIPQPIKMEYLEGEVDINCEVKGLYSEDVADQGYKLFIDDGIVIKASTKAGFFYAYQTLNQIKFQCEDTIPKMIIMDRPRYSYRSFMLDSCRHFFKVEDIKKMIKVCSQLKLNKFHWHLSDDQGFRAEIEKYPQLNQIGSVRHGSKFGKEQNDLDYGGYYTKAEMREIVEYANEQFIEVIPEIDIPGHASAILASMPELSCNDKKVELKVCGGVFQNLVCAGNENTYKLIFDIIDELCEVFTGEYFHIGGDEAPKTNWKSCEKCQSKIKEENLKDEEELHGYFVNRVADYLKTKGKKAIGWNDSLKGKNLDEDITIQYWMDRDNVCKNSKNPLIVSEFFHYYMDYPYAMTPMNKVYNYNPQVNLNVIGVESPVWTEYITDFKKIEYMCFPRYFAFAQTAWCTEIPKYKEFEQDLKNIIGMFDNENWAKEKEWTQNPFRRLHGTVKHFREVLTKDIVKGFFHPDKNEK